ncbi:MAG TPA: hypothetical protein DIT04_03895 [Dysgonomonas sp.]|nr:hypothetical protein [Dysgonomonas sp.]
MSQEIQLLRDSEVKPSEQVIRDIYDDKLFEVYKDIFEIISNPELQLTHEWNYYRDGKAWLCKVIYKKKTVFWLSLGDKLIKTSFFFTEKTRGGVMELPINEKIKNDFLEVKNTGKLFALIMDIDSKEQLKDFIEVIKYKKSLK